MLHAALESARQTDQAELLDDALRFAQGRLVVRGLAHATCGEVGAALEAAAGPSLAVEDRAGFHALLARCVADPLTSTPRTLWFSDP